MMTDERGATMFNEGDRVVWVKDGEEAQRGRVVAEDESGLTLVMFDGDDEPDEAVTDDLVSEDYYNAALAAEEREQHSVKVGYGYHVYEVRGSVLQSQAPKQIAACDGDSLAFTLDTLREEGQIDDNSRIGILHRQHPDEPGTWLVNPYAKGRS